MSAGNANISDMRPDPFRMMVKVFAFGRPAAIAERTVGLITRARAAGVRHPRLYPDASGRLVHEYDGHRLVAMDFVPGRTFYELGRPPRPDELGAVVEQAVRIHSVDAYPEPVSDPWAIANLALLANQVRGLLDDEQRRLVNAVISDMSGIEWASLPEALIHADLTAGNVLLGDDGTISVLDFALANRWPRLQEIAVIAASLLHGSPDPIASRMSSVAALYSSLAPSPLTSLEWDALHVFGRAAAAMELLGGLAQWQQGNRGAETDSLVEIGTTGLRDYALRYGVALPAAAADDSVMGVGSGGRSDTDGDQIQFGSARTPRWLLQRHPRVRWLAAGATTAIVVAVAVIVAVTSTGTPRHQAGGSTGSAASSAGGSPVSAGSRGQWDDVPGPVAVRLGHPLLGEGASGNWELLAVGGGWEPGARGPVLIRVQLAKGLVTFTSLPRLASNGAVTVLETQGETLIRPWDVVPGYLVPDGHPARGLPAGLGEGDYTFPGPLPGQFWIGANRGTTPVLRLMAITGGTTGQVIRLPVDGAYPAVADGQGYVLVQEPGGVYDARPDGLRKVAAGNLVAAGERAWLVSDCPRAANCVNTVIDPAAGTSHVLPGRSELVADPAPFWPPGTVCPDGTSAALLRIGPGQNGTVRLVSLRTGAHRDIAVGRLSQNASLVWSPDSRWLFTLAASGAVEAVNVRTGHVGGLGVALPPVSYLASGTPG
jgi:Ser/Thr protein kinase RdoA (MazF antagonist)